MKRKIISVLLCVALVVSVTPIVYAQDTINSTIPITDTVSPTQTASEPYIVGEITEKRTENTKHFLMSDRSVLAAMYDKAVHYEEDGSWLDIDNSFSTNDENEFENRNNSFKTKFAKKSNGNKLVTVTKENYSLSWMLDDAKTVSAEISQANETETEDISVLKNLEGSVTYPEIQNDVDLQYVVSGGNIKENIILQSADAPTEYSFTYKFNKLNYRTNDNNQIELYDKDDSENVVFTIDAPYMYDSDKAYSNDVEMQISETSNGFTLTLAPDKEWLLSEDRVYPVVIDPTVLHDKSSENIWDITLKESQPNDSEYTDIETLIGSDTSGNAYRTLMKFDALPDIEPGGIIINAKMSLTAFPAATSNGVSLQRPRPTDDIQVNIHRVTLLWSEYGATWNSCANKYDPIIEDYFIYNNTDNVFTADITNLVSDWYKGVHYNYGIMIKAADESAANHVMQFTSSNFGDSDNDVHTSWRPYLVVNYRTCVGLEDYWSYTTQDMGGYGTGYVNNYNGNLTYIHDDVSFNSLVNGFTLSHVYNSANSRSSTGRYGTGWGLNLVQTFEPITIANNDSVKFVYTDGDGTKHYFVQLDDGSIVDEDGLGYTYTDITTAGSELTSQLTDKDGNILKFDQWYALRKIIDTNGNTITLNYSPVPNRFNYLTSITTSSGGGATLSYDSDYLLKSITDNAGRTTSFSYHGGTLKQITYPDGTDLEFEFYFEVNDIIGDSSWLKEVILPNGYRYIYDPVKEKVGTSVEVTSSGLETNELRYTYDDNQTTVEDVINRAITYQFDSFGRVICAYDRIGNSYSESYTPNSETRDGIFANNKISTASNNIRYINNLLTNGAFINGLSSWSQYEEAPNETQISVVTDQSYISHKSVKITSTASSIQALLQYPSTTAGKTYTLSANLKAENVVSTTHGVGVEIVTSSSAGTKHYFSDFILGTTDTEINDGFVTATATAAMASDENITRISVGLYNASGTVWVDSVQLEEGDTANKINLVENSSFEKGITGFTTSTTNSSSGSVNSEAKSGNYSLKMSGLSLQNYNYKQDVLTSGKAGDVYSFGAWTKGYSLPYGDDLGRYKLVCEFTYNNGETSRETIPFNTLVNDWQYGAKNIMAQKDYTKLTLFLCYNKNCNYAYFDNVFLYRDTAQSYTYDNDGNVVSTADYASQQSNYEYGNSSSLSRLLSPEGTSYEYLYDSKKNLVASRSNVGVQSDIKYDSYGNAISTQVGANNYSTTIQSGKTYYIRLKGTGKYLTVENSGTTSGTNVCQSAFTGANNQKWLVERAIGGGYYLYPQSATSMSLNVANNTQDGNVTIATHSTSDKQRFDITTQSDYTYKIVAKCSTDSKLITVPYAATQNNVAVWTPQGELNANQSWYFEDASIAPVTQIEDGAVYQLRARHSGRYVSISDQSTADGALLVQYAQSYLDSQKFIIKKQDDTNYYTLSPLNAPEKYVNVTGTVTSYECKLIEIRDTQTTDVNQFAFTYDSQKGAFQIYPKSNSNECFAVAFSDCTDNASVVSANITDSDNRYFVLEKVSDKITSSATYQSNGNYPQTVTDSRGNTTTYTYDTARGLQTKVEDANGNETNYNYNSLNDRLITVSSDNSTVRYSYNNIKMISGITSPSGTLYRFNYDSFGNTRSISIGSQALTTNTYNIFSGLLTKSTYGNGQTIEYNYDTLDRITEKLYNGVTKVKFRYDKFGNLYEKTDLFTNTTYRYNYDLIGRIMGVVGSNGTSLNYIYDDFNRTQKYIAKFGDRSNITEYIYGDSAVAGQKDGLIYGVKQDNVQRISYAYDELARLDTRTLNTTTPFVTQYGYHEGATPGTTTTLIKTVQNGNDIYEYAYDSVGNITQIKINNTVYESYTYDGLNQLKTVTRGNDVYQYNYDNGGNIQSVTLNGTTIKSYGYTDTAWKDKLTTFNGQTITYDEIGNPLKYRDGFNFTWSNGRQLTSIISNTMGVSFVYNADGLRASKTAGGTTTDYYWLEGVLLGQKTGNTYITFLYDENGTVYGLKYNNTYLYYSFNAQGDVVGIVNASGNVIARYDYDAWGNILSITNGAGVDISQNFSHIANINPIRYRGYYYDEETGFYYLQSRYYDPVTQRFLNADGLVSTGQGILGNNMFAYCGNNPVNFFDPTGQFLEILGAISNALSYIFAAIVVVAVLSSPTVQENITRVVDSVGVGISRAVSSIKVGIENKKKEKEKEKEKTITSTRPQEESCNYWSAELVSKKVVVYDSLTVEEAALRVSMGKSIMCRNQEAAKHILFINGYVNAVGPETHGDEGFYYHYHPTRNHTGYNSIHIWYYD